MLPRRIYTGLIILLLAPLLARGQFNLENHAKFEMARELDNLRILDIVEDSLDFIWLATSNGVFRFDGINLKQFTTGSTGKILKIPKSNEYIFLGRKKLTRYHSLSNQTNVITVDSISNKNDNLYNGTVYNESIAFYATQNGLVRHDLETNQFEFTSLFDAEGKPLTLLSISHDNSKDNVIWLGTRKKGLIKYNLETNGYEQILLKSEDADLQDETNTITIIHPWQDELVLGTWFGGFVRYNKTDHSQKLIFVQDRLPNDGTISYDLALEIIPINQDTVWLSSTKGAMLINLRTDDIIYHVHNGNNSRVYENPPRLIDKKDRIWMGREEGLRLVDTLRNQFEVIGNPYVNESLWDIPFRIITSTDKRELFFCNMVSRGLYSYNRENGIWKLFPPEKPTSYGVLKGHDLICSNDTVWMLEETGLYYLDRSRELIVKYPLDYSSVKLDFRDFTRMPNGDFLLLTAFDGLYRANLKSGAIVKADSNVQSTYPDALKFRGDLVHMDSDHNLWMSWKNHIFIETRDTLFNITHHFPVGGEILNVLDYFETDEKIWIAIPAGIFSIEKGPIPEIIINKVSNQESPDFVVDKDENIWSIYSKLYRTAFDGLNSVIYGINDGTHAPGKYGFEQIDMVGEQIILASRGRYSIFDPSRIVKNQEIPRAYIDEIYINGVTTIPDSNLFLKKNLALRANDNNIKLNFSAIGFTKPLSIRFRYRLRDLETTWNEAEISNTSVTYNQIPGGNYIFEVQAANDNEQWGPVHSLSINVAIPFLARKSTWFIAAIFILIPTVYFYHRRIRYLKDQARINQRILTLERKALRAQMNPHFVFNALNSIQYLITEGQEKKAIAYLNKFSKLLRGVLDNSRSTTTKLSSELDVLKNYLELEFLRLGDNFQYEIRVDPNLSQENIEVAAMLFQPFIENAVHHGLAHRREGGKLKLEILDKDDHLLCIISDNGIGRKKSMQMNKYGHKSTGIELVSERLTLLSDLSPDDMIRIIDLYHENGESAGTKVEIKIPMNIHAA